MTAISDRQAEKRPEGTPETHRTEEKTDFKNIKRILRINHESNKKISENTMKKRITLGKYQTVRQRVQRKLYSAVSPLLTRKLYRQHAM